MSYVPETLPVHPGHSPLVFQMDALRRERHMTSSHLTSSAGLAPTVLRRWRSGVMPTIGNFDAALNVLGYRLAIVPKDQS